MTNKEAIADQESKTDTWSIKDVADTLAKHGLIVEQEPCGDAISRQKVLDVINLNWEYRRNCIRAIEKLPPVKQEPSSSENDLLQRLRKRISDLYNTDVTYDNGDINTMDTPTLDKVLEYFDSEVTTRICNQLISVNELKEIREEIAQIKATQLYSTIDLKDMVLAIIDKHMEEHHD